MSSYLQFYVNLAAALEGKPQGAITDVHRL
jgi:hypothetical protein